MAVFDRLIRGGTIFDGTRVPRYRADIGIKDGVIAAIGRISPHDAGEVLDAEGLNVAPGFIDLHTHYDAQVFWDPYCSLSGWHGITSAVIGNCGFGFAPVRPDERERSMLSMTRVEAIPLASMKAGMPWDWVSFPEFLDSVERTPKAINLLPYVPVGPLLIWVLGFEDAKAGRRPTDDEHAELCRLLHEAMDAGGCGWSAQRMLPTGPAAVQRDFDGTPMPTDVMHDDTCRALARVLGRRNEGFMQMLLVSGDNKRDRAFYEEMAETERPADAHERGSGVRSPPGHPSPGPRSGWRAAASAGSASSARASPRMPASTSPSRTGTCSTIPQPWCEATTGTREERKRKLADPARRQALKDRMPITATGPLPDIAIVGPKLERNARWEDHTLAIAGEKMGKHPVDVMLDMAVEEDLATEFFAAPPNGDIGHLREIVDDPYVLFGVSDGGAHTKFLTAGRYPTETLCKIVREHEMLSLEEAHWRLSALPAMVAGFEGRGVLRKGAPADIVVYDYERLKVLPAEVAHDLPGGEWRRVQRAEGYRFVLVNGEVTIRDDRETGACSGWLLRHGDGAARREPLPALAAG